MTTIVYKDGVIAYDSRITAGDMIVTDNYNKKIISNGRTYFISGAAMDYPVIIRLYEGGDGEVNGTTTALVVEPNGDLFVAAANKDSKLWVERTKRDEIEALGSGEMYAYTAMDMGADAKLAVQMAIKRDMYSGGRVRTYKIA